MAGLVPHLHNQTAQQCFCSQPPSCDQPIYLTYKMLVSVTSSPSSTLWPVCPPPNPLPFAYYPTLVPSRPPLGPYLAPTWHVTSTGTPYTRVWTYTSSLQPCGLKGAPSTILYNPLSTSTNIHNPTNHQNYMI